MENKNILRLNTEKILIGCAIVIIAATSRIVPHIPNVVPITGLALFSGSYLDRKYAILIPILAMVVSDSILGWHSTILYVYGSFILITFLGKVLKNNPSISSLLQISLVSSLLFFIITNFGVWVGTPLYAKNLSGLVDAYGMGLPFFRNTIAGDLFYSFSFFYGFTFLKNILKKNSKIQNLVVRKL